MGPSQRGAKLPEGAGRSAIGGTSHPTRQPPDPEQEEPHHQDLDTKGDEQGSRAGQRDHDEPDEGEQPTDHED